MKKLGQTPAEHMAVPGRDTAQAMFNLQRMAAGIMEAHPGLLDLEKNEAHGVEPVPTEDELKEILAALGVEAGPEKR